MPKNSLRYVVIKYSAPSGTFDDKGEKTCHAATVSEAHEPFAMARFFTKDAREVEALLLRLSTKRANKTGLYVHEHHHSCTEDFEAETKNFAARGTPELKRVFGKRL